MKRIGTALTNMFASGSEAGEILKLLIKAVAVTIETLGVAVKIVATPFRALWKIAEGFFEALGVGGGEMQALTESWFAFLKGIDVGFQKTYIAAEKLGRGIGNLAAMMKKPFKDAFQWIVARINQFWEALPGWMKWSIRQMTGAAEAVGATLSGFFTQTEDEKAATKLKEAAKAKEIQQNKVLIEQAKTLDLLWKDIGKTIGDGITSAIKGVVQGTQSLGQAAMNVLNSISNKLLDAGINALLGGVFGGSSIGKFLGFGKAAGGHVQRGEAYPVGERGPEIFVPSGGGRIVPNNGIGGNTTINVSVDASGSSVEGEGQNAGELGRMLASAIQQELVRQQRPGGLLA